MPTTSQSKYVAFYFCALVGMLFSCDTASTIEDPDKNYFIKYYGGDGDQEGVDMVVGADGSVYLLGNSSNASSTTGKQLYLVKADAEGKLIWERTFGGKFDENAKDLELTTDGRLVILANSQKGAAENDILLMTVTLDGIKIDSTLVGLQTILGTPIEADEDAISISQTSDGFIVSGSTTSVTSKGIAPEDFKDAFHLRLTNNLVIFNESDWSRTYGTIGSDVATGVYQVNSGLFYVFGFTNIDPASTSIADFNFWVYQLGQTGVPSGSQMYPGTIVTNEKLTSVIINPPQPGAGFLLVGTSTDASGSYDIYVNKLRKTLTFNPSLDYQINKPLSASLGKLDIANAKVSIYASSSSGYLILANEKSGTSDNFYLTKIDNDGQIAWTNPQNLIFGGQKDDYIGAVAELPDGRIIVMGTMSIGDEGQLKMALIKLNKEGKFLD